MERVRFAPSRARLIVSVLATVMAVWLHPSAALAATATYSGISPKPGSSSVVTTPTLTVTVYAFRGVKGSANYSMYLDGAKVTPSIKYTMSRYRRFQLTYRRRVPLAPGQHKVVVKVRDFKRYSSSQTWYFTVLAPPVVPREMPVTIESGACPTCHPGYPARHPMQNCPLCHGPGRPVPGGVYGPTGNSAHTPACAASPCHQQTTGPFPHVLSSDCTSCHNGTYAFIAPVHGAATGEDHLSSSVQCTLAGCHDRSLTIEHFRHSVNGSAFACETCHTSTDPAVIAAFDARSTACTGCHGGSAIHSAASASHALSANGCLTGTGCHAATDAVALHGGDCAACHAPGRVTSLVCATCHGTDPHPDIDARHTPGPLGCTTAACHASDVRTFHSTGASAPGCAACHGAGKPALTLVCTTAGCHPASSAAHGSHPVAAASQAFSIGGVSFGTHACSECHTLDLVTLHNSKCATCHAAIGTATLTGGCAQSGCHAAGGAHPQHAALSSAHTLASATTCVMTGCHTGGTNVAALHAAHGGCAACHGAGKTPTLVCSSAGCHSMADAHPVSNPHPKMTAMHSTGLPASCVKAGCHPSELAVLHTAASGCATCHGASKTPTAQCTASGCHPSDVTAVALHPTYATAHTAPSSTCTAVGCHLTGVIGLHAAGPGCAACHAAGKPALTLTCTATGCHGADVTSPLLHPDFATLHLATQAGCTAAGCHDANVVTIHTTGRLKPGCGACHGAGKPALTLACETVGCHPGTLASHSAHSVELTSAPVTIAGTGFGVHSCSECHAPGDLIALHAGSCAACHTGPLTGVTIGGGCAQTGCHASGSLALHGSIDAAHTLAAAPCTGAGCHTATTNVAALHAAGGCAVCHSGGTPTVECSTPGCHSSSDAHPVTSPHPRATALHTTGLSASCVKSGCHPSDLSALHAQAGGCGTCHWGSKPASATCVQSGCHTSSVSAMHSSHPATPAPAVIRINGLNLGTYACGTCHANLELQTVHAGVNGCATCHPGAAGAVGMWDGGCTQAACHGAGSAHPMHANVDADHTMATQPKCTSSGCHQGNSNVGGRDFALMHLPTAKSCANCHQAGKTLVADCASCHAQWATGDHQADHRACNDCHAPYVWDPVTSTANKGANLVAGLHWPLFDAAWTLSIGRAQIRSGYPYGDYTMLVFPGVLGTPGPYSSTYADRTVTYSCSACHTGAGKNWVHPAYNNFGCGSGGDCHQHHGNWDPAQASETYVHYTPPAGWTATMRW